MVIYKCIQFVAWCDKCNYQYPMIDDISERRADFINNLRSDNWAIGKKVVCPECNNKHNPYPD